MARRKKRKTGGTKRMREFGYTRVEVWLDKNEHALIAQAAEKVNRKLATFVREAAFGSAAVVVQVQTGNPAMDEENWEKMTDPKQGGERDA